MLPQSLSAIVFYAFTGADSQAYDRHSPVESQRNSGQFSSTGLNNVKQENHEQRWGIGLIDLLSPKNVLCQCADG